MTAQEFSQLAAVGWSARVAALLATAVDAGLLPARVIGVERGAAQVTSPDGDVMASGSDGLAVGDWVALDGSAVVERAPRWSALERLGPDGKPQVLAANVDIVVIAAPADRLSPARVERELVVAWDSGAVPVVVLTKLDLAATDALDALAARLAGTEVIATSIANGSGVERLRARLGASTTSVMLGPSGAGKSSLVNALVGSEVLAVGDVRAGDRRGRHTTTARRLIALPGGGALIDTPGLRALAADVASGSVAAAFTDIAELAGGCRFADCSHRVEPACAVLDAVGRGALDAGRLESFRKLQNEMAHEDRRVDPLARQADLRVWKAIGRANRHGPKRGGR